MGLGGGVLRCSPGTAPVPGGRGHGRAGRCVMPVTSRPRPVAVVSRSAAGSRSSRLAGRWSVVSGLGWWSVDSGFAWRSVVRGLTSVAGCRWLRARRAVAGGLVLVGRWPVGSRVASTAGGMRTPARGGRKHAMRVPSRRAVRERGIPRHARLSGSSRPRVTGGYARCGDSTATRDGQVPPMKGASWAVPAGQGCSPWRHGGFPSCAVEPGAWPRSRRYAAARVQRSRERTVSTVSASSGRLSGR